MKTALDAFIACSSVRGQHGNSTCSRQHTEAWAEHTVYWNHRTPEQRARLKRETSLKRLVHGLALYIDSHQELFDSPVGDDGYCGDYVADIAKAIIALLSAESGRVDCGTIDHYVREMAVIAGLELDK